MGKICLDVEVVLVVAILTSTILFAAWSWWDVKKLDRRLKRGRGRYWGEVD